ncbi:hepatic lectin-like [Mytilus galloprovincialis]
MVSLNFLFLVIYAGAVNAGCPFGWYYFSESCYLFSSYKLDWFRAAASCNAHHSNLVIVESKEEEIFLRNTSMTLKRGFWLDSTDDVVEGYWKWATTEANLTYTDWYPGQPSNGGSTHDEDCAHIYPGLSYRWNDVHCTYEEYFICEDEYPGDGDNIIG